MIFALFFGIDDILPVTVFQWPNDIHKANRECPGLVRIADLTEGITKLVVEGGILLFRGSERFDLVAIDSRRCADCDGIDLLLNQFKGEPVCLSQTHPEQQAATDPDKENQKQLEFLTKSHGNEEVGIGSAMIAQLSTILHGNINRFGNINQLRNSLLISPYFRREFPCGKLAGRSVSILSTPWHRQTRHGSDRRNHPRQS